MDFTSIISSLDATAAALTVLVAAAIYAQLSFARWAAPKVARFFMMRGMRK